MSEPQVIGVDEQDVEPVEVERWAALAAASLADQGVTLKQFNDDIYDAFAEAAEEVYEGVVDHSPLAKRIHESFVEGRKTIGAWAKISDQAYVEQRNRALGV